MASGPNGTIPVASATEMRPFADPLAGGLSLLTARRNARLN